MKRARKIDILDLLADGLRRGFWCAVFLAALLIVIGGGVTL